MASAVGFYGCGPGVRFGSRAGRGDSARRAAPQRGARNHASGCDGICSGVGGGSAARELEAAVLLKAATRLQAISDDWEARKPDLDGALTYNRKLWTILVSAVTHPENPIPGEIRQSIVDLGMFTFNRMLSVLADPAPGKLAVLVNINREIAAGLRAQPPAKAA